MDFLTHIQLLEVPFKKSKTHTYTVREDLVAVYCALKGLTKKDDIDLLVMKMNRINKSDLKTSSFTMRISNMNHTLYGKGNAHNSQQGKAVAEYCLKLIRNKQLDVIQLKEHINQLYKENIL